MPGKLAARAHRSGGLRYALPVLRRSAPWLAPVLVVLLGGAGPFEGCDQGSSDAPRPLPHDPGAACFFDEDCVPTGCEALRCIAGTCVEVAPIRDGDGDGHAPPPCGMDCDDESATIAPGATELCDLVDQDCDGRIDEDALPRAIRYELTTSDRTMSAASWDDRVVVSDATFFASGGVRARRLALDGTLGTVEPLLAAPRVARAVDAAATEEGAWFAIALEPSEAEPELTLALVDATRGASGEVQVAGEPTTRAVPSLGGLAIVTGGGVPLGAWDGEDATRWAWSPEWPEPVQVGEAPASALVPLDLATDGAHVVVPSGPRTLAFLAIADGALAASVEADGDLANGSPLGSDDGFVWALVRDAFDHSVQRVLATGAAPLHTLPTGESLRLGVDRTRDGLVITRAGATSARAWVLDGDAPGTIHRTFGPDEISGVGVEIVGMDVASTTRGTAIVTNFGAGGSSLAVLACGAEE